MPRPDFLVIGAPKAGTSALHAALAQHPQVFVSRPKEPKYWLCDDAPPPKYDGPGDAHSQQEWVWSRAEYDALFARASINQVRGESTPFYLWNKSAQRRIAEQLPGVRLVVVLRDPIDRAYSNWMHLWSDGLEPIADFEEAFSLQQRRVDLGWAPFWRYRDLGLYGEQLQHLYRYVDRDRVLVLRYRDMVDHPVRTLDRICGFLGITQGILLRVPGENSRPFVKPGWRSSLLGPIVRAGAWLGRYAAPEIWRKASIPLVAALAGPGEKCRPHLSPDQRARLISSYTDDIALLTRLTGANYSEWTCTVCRGSYAQRAAACVEHHHSSEGEPGAERKAPKPVAVLWSKPSAGF